MKFENSVRRCFYTKCDIVLDGAVISKELISKTFLKFLCQVPLENGHTTAMTICPAEIVFDAIMIAYAAVSNIMLNGSYKLSAVDALEIDDYVLYGDTKKQRYIFKGKGVSPINPKLKMVFLEQDNGKNRTMVPPTKWHFITPYQGSAKTTDGRGIRRKSGKRELFFKEVLNFEETSIPNSIDKSTIFVMDKSEADYIIKNLSFRFGNNEVGLLDIVTASYFTENDEFPYSGNTSKTEPVLKFTSKVSVAREKAFERDGNENIGVVISGNSSLMNGETEFPRILNRQKLRYVHIILPDYTIHAIDILKQYEDMKLMACTKDFLLSYSRYRDKSVNEFIDNLLSRIENVVNLKRDFEISNTDLTWKSLKKLRKSLVAIKRSDSETDIKEKFVMNAFYILNLLSTAPFPMCIFEKKISEGLIDVVSPNVRLMEMKDTVSKLQDSVSKHANFIYNALLKLYEQNFSSCSIMENMHRVLCQLPKNSNVSVIIPKKYYSDVIKEMAFFKKNLIDNNVSFYTPGSFDGQRTYDMVLALGCFNSKFFNVLKCTSSNVIKVLINDYDETLCKNELLKVYEEESYYNKRTSVNLQFDYDEFEEYKIVENVLEESVDSIRKFADKDIKEVDEYVERLNEKATLHFLDNVSKTYRSSGVKAEAAYLVSFENGDFAMLTKLYKAYVINKTSAEVSEVLASELQEGDNLIFTKNNDDTKDIVDTILDTLTNDGKLNKDIQDAYTLSKLWKQKLRNYMLRHNISATDLARNMKLVGSKLQETSIKTWLDPYCRIVGPRNKESLLHIAKVIQDVDMEKDTDEYFNACSIIRKIRIVILKDIGVAIMSKLSGKNKEKDIVMSEVYDKVEKLADIHQISKISKISVLVPVNTVNRPYSVQEVI